MNVFLLILSKSAGVVNLFLIHSFQWILDALLCNGLGIYVGIKTLKYFQVKTYCWRGLWKIPGYRYIRCISLVMKWEELYLFCDLWHELFIAGTVRRGKLKRIFAQFGPHTWIEFDWKPTSSLGRWVAVLGIIFVVSFPTTAFAISRKRNKIHIIFILMFYSFSWRNWIHFTLNLCYGFHTGYGNMSYF